MPNRTLAAAGPALVALALAGGRAAAFQEYKQVTKPETSKDRDFEPAALAKLAVVVGFNGDGPREGQTAHERLAEDVFLECLLAKGYTVVARSDLRALLREKALQESDLTEEQATRVGKFLNVPAVLMVRVIEVSSDTSHPYTMVGRATVGARLLSVETGAVLWHGRYREVDRVTTAAGCGRVLFKAAATLAEAFPAKRPPDASAARRAVGPKTLPRVAVIMVGGRGKAGKAVGRPTPPEQSDAAAPRQRVRASARSSKTPALDSQVDREQLVEETFAEALSDRGYRLVSRSDLWAIAREREFQESGFTDENAVSAGKLLNVPAVLVVRITDFTAEPLQELATTRQLTLSRAALGARLIEVSSGEVHWAHSEWRARDANTEQYGKQLLEAVAKGVASFLPPAPETDGALMQQAAKLASLGQLTAAANCYRAVVATDPNSREAKTAQAKLRALGDK